MTPTRRMALAAIALCTTWLLQACGGADSAKSNASVRLINATHGQTSLDLLSNQAGVVSGVLRDAASSHGSVAEGSVTLQVNSGGSAWVSSTSTLSKGVFYSVVAYELNGTARLAVLTENTPAPSGGNAQWRVVNLAGSSGALDVYLTDPGTDLAGVGSPSLSLAASTSTTTSPTLSVSPGTYRLRVTGSGNTDDLRLDLPSVTIGNQQVVNVLLTPAAGASLLNAVWAPEKAAVTAVRNPNARVRLVAAVAGSGVVAASAGGTVLSSGSVSPAVSDYLTVPAGSLAAPTATALVDNNFAPGSSSVKLRLLNGLTGAATGLILSADFAVLASNVTPGQVSAPALATASTVMRVEATAAVTQQSVYLQPALNLSGGSVYTLFMLGDSSAPVGVLRKDR